MVALLTINVKQNVTKVLPPGVVKSPTEIHFSLSGLASLALFFILYEQTEEIATPTCLYPVNGTKGDRIEEQLAYIPPNVSSKPLKILLWQGLNQDVWGGLNPQEGDEVFFRESCLGKGPLNSHNGELVHSASVITRRFEGVKKNRLKCFFCSRRYI